VGSGFDLNDFECCAQQKARENGGFMLGGGLPAKHLTWPFAVGHLALVDVVDGLTKSGTNKFIRKLKSKSKFPLSTFS
jgi:hypothetical protein